MIYVLLLAIVPHDLTAEERGDCIECNTVFSGDGKILFDQLIFKEWTPEESRFNVIDWRIVRDLRTQTPLFERGEYTVAWQDGNVLRIVRSPSMYVTGEFEDPEVKERTWLPQELRRRLLPERGVRCRSRNHR